MNSDARALPGPALWRRRGGACFVVLCASIGAVLAHVCIDAAGDVVLARARRDRAWPTGTLHDLGPCRLTGYATAIVGATFALLGLMESVDLLGGPWILGAGLTLPIALGVALAGWCSTRWFAMAESIVIRVIDAWFAARARQIDQNGAFRVVACRTPPPSDSGLGLARSSSTSRCSRAEEHS